MRSVHIAIAAGGRLSKECIARISSADYVIGVDHGAYWLLNNGVTPGAAIGDFDSCTSVEVKEIKKKIAVVLEYPPVKDKTDLKLAVDYAVSLNPKTVCIYGATGKRLDHELSAIFLLKKLLDKGIKGVIKDAHNEIQLVNSRIDVLRSQQFTYMSLIPYTKSIVITLQGFAYNVQRRLITQGDTLGISNELKAKTGNIDVHEGVAIVMLSRD